MGTHKVGIALVMILTALSALGCSVVPLSKPIVSISSPAHGSQVNMGQEVLVQAIAADAAGIARIELWADGQLATAAQPPAPQASHMALLRWTPAAPGAHVLLVKAFNVSNVASEPAAVAVNANSANPTAPVPSVASTAAIPTAEPPKAMACSNDAAFVQDVTVPAGTTWMAGQAFNKIWRVQNTGTCAWGPGYDLVFVGGEAMTNNSTTVVPVTAPGATTDLVVAMLAPTTPGAHVGQWRLRNAANGLLGATLQVSISVLDPLPPQVAVNVPAPSNNGCPPPVIASFDAYYSVEKKGRVGARLIWGKVDNATSAVIDQGIGGIATPGGTEVNPNQTTTYTLTATGCGGMVTKQVTITVKPLASAVDLGSVQPIQPLQPMVPKNDGTLAGEILKNMGSIQAIQPVQPIVPQNNGTLAGEILKNMGTIQPAQPFQPKKP